MNDPDTSHHSTIFSVVSIHPNLTERASLLRVPYLKTNSIKAILGIGLYLTVSLPVRAQATPILYDPSQESHGTCNNIDNSYICAQHIEALVLVHLSRHAWRDAKGLHLRLSSGKVLTFVTIPEDTGYSLRGLIAARFFIIEKQLIEGTVYFALDSRTGAMIRLLAPPVLSPAQRYGVAMSDASAYNATGIEIFQIDQQGMKRIFHHEANDWLPHSPVWRSDSVLAFKRRCLVPACRSDGLIVLRNGRFTLADE